MSSSLYIHIPFCAAKCSYCSFNSYAGLKGLHDRYVAALGMECSLVAGGSQAEPLQTIFLGGGTPSLLSGEQLKHLFSHLSAYFEIEKDAEISMEVNPGTVDPKKLDTIRQCGVNRLSIGVQSFHDRELREIGRIHSAQEAMQAIETAKGAGFANVSIDLMYGLPGQSPGSWQENLERALSISVPHLSLYQLTVEEGTPLVPLLAGGTMHLPDEDAVAEMDSNTASLLQGSTLSQYEISNYARDGFQCRHNCNYWQNGEYYAVGAGAVSYTEGTRMKNTSSPEHYCTLLECGQPVQIEKECLDPEASFRESVIMGLRMTRGVSLQRLHDQYGMGLEFVYGETVQGLCNRRLLERRNGYLRLTKQGRVFANLVMADLV